MNKIFAEKDMLDAVYEKNPDIIKRKIAGELILVPISSSIALQQKIFSLNEIGEYIYDRLDGVLTLQEILTLVVEEFFVSEEQAAVDILKFIGAVFQAGLVVRKNN